MEFLPVLGEIFGYAAVLSGLLIYISVKRTRIFVAKIVTDSLFMLNQLLLGMLTGASLYAIALGRSGVFYHRGRHKWADNPWWIVLFIALTLISPILTWAGPISLLPSIGSVICVFSYYVTNTVLLRILSFFGEGLWLLYGIFSGSVAVAICGVISLVSIALGMLNEWRQYRKKKKTVALSDMD